MRQNRGLCGKQDIYGMMIESVRHGLDEAIEAQNLFDGCSDEERKALYFLLFISDDGGYISPHSVYPFLDILLRKSGKGARVIEALRKKGFLGISRDYHRGRFLLSGIREFLWRMLASEAGFSFDASRFLRDTPQSKKSIDLAQEALSIVVLFLTYARHNPIRVTKSGRIYRRQLGKLMRLLGAAREDKVDFAFRFCYHAKGFLIREKVPYQGERSWLLMTKEGASWARLSATDQIYDMCRSWCDFLLRGDPKLGFVFHILGHLAPGQVTTINRLASAFESRVVIDPGDGPLRKRIRGIINDLRLIGILEAIPSPSSLESVLMVTDLGRAIMSSEDGPLDLSWEESFDISDDGRILASRRLEPRFIAMLDDIADLVRADHVLEYKLSRDKIMQVCSGGVSIEEIHGFLRRHARGELPEGVEVGLRECAGAFDRGSEALDIN